MGIDVIIEKLDELVPLGLSSVLLFPVLDDSGMEKVSILLVAIYYLSRVHRIESNSIAH